MARRLALPALLLALTLLCACNDQQQRFQTAAQLTAGGNAEAGMADLRKYGCSGCHTIPGIEGAYGQVGPPLNQFANRVYIAGRLPNTPENLMLWIQKPQQVVPNNAMPDMGIGEQDSRDIAAYLYTLH
jgi:cytochrome c2